MEGAGIDRWEESFDSWTPRRRGDTPDDTGVDLDRAELLRLARELAEKRHAGHAEASSELERLKQSLRERAEAIAVRERELAELEHRLEGGRPAKSKKKTPVGTDAIVARERAALERAQALEARERELEARAAQIAAETARVAERKHELAARLAEAEARASEAAAERELAAAERNLLDDRERATRSVEKELAALRVQLERERTRSGIAAETGDPSEVDPPVPAGKDELRRLEARLEAREHELGLMRQRLDADRNALLARERALHRREAAEARLSFEAPLAPPSFSEGLAAFTHGRSSQGRSSRS
jgi:chromosome segregation ATPase